MRIEMLHQPPSAGALPSLCWVTDLYKVHSHGHPPDRHERQTMKRRFATEGENALIQGIYWSGVSCPMSNSRIQAMVFKPCISNGINIRNDYYPHKNIPENCDQFSGSIKQRRKLLFAEKFHQVLKALHH